jgi:hypothetical protein
MHPLAAEADHGRHGVSTVLGEDFRSPQMPSGSTKAGRDLIEVAVGLDQNSPI